MKKSELSTAQLTVLGVLDERPQHGFAIAKLLAPEGAVGQVWTLRPPLVYRALSAVTVRGLASAVTSEGTAIGPPRTIYAITARGRKHLWRWLLTPVDHVREVRTELLLKLALLDRLGADVRPLLRAQRAHFTPIREALRERTARGEGGKEGSEEGVGEGGGKGTDFDRLLALWRAESVEATVRFIDRALAAPPD